MRLMLFFLLQALIFPSANAMAHDCQLIEPWFTDGHLKAPANAGFGERVAMAQKEYAMRMVAAERLWRLYQSGRLSRTRLDDCLIGLPDRQNFLETFYYMLFSTSIRQLDEETSPSIRALMRIFHAKFGAGVPVFRVLGSFAEQNPTPFPAGVERATNSMYMNFGEIDPNDWLLIFVHETLHAVDEQIMVGVEGYSDPVVPKKMITYSETLSSPSALPAADREALDRWLGFGIDRGLLAEYRAWTATFQIYEDGLKEGLWKPRPWLDEILALRSEDVPLPSFTFRYLDQRSLDPSDGIFARPLLAEALRDFRSRLRQAPTPPPLYRLGEVLKPAPMPVD
jgi:hypothetical protein